MGDISPRDDPAGPRAPRAHGPGQSGASASRAADLVMGNAVWSVSTQRWSITQTPSAGAAAGEGARASESVRGGGAREEERARERGSPGAALCWPPGEPLLVPSPRWALGTIKGPPAHLRPASTPAPLGPRPSPPLATLDVLVSREGEGSGGGGESPCTWLPTALRAREPRRRRDEVRGRLGWLMQCGQDGAAARAVQLPPEPGHGLRELAEEGGGGHGVPRGQNLHEIAALLSVPGDRAGQGGGVRAPLGSWM